MAPGARAAPPVDEAPTAPPPRATRAAPARSAAAALAAALTLGLGGALVTLLARRLKPRAPPSADAWRTAPPAEASCDDVSSSTDDTDGFAAAAEPAARRDGLPARSLRSVRRTVPIVRRALRCADAARPRARRCSRGAATRVACTGGAGRRCRRCRLRPRRLR